MSQRDQGDLFLIPNSNNLTIERSRAGAFGRCWGCQKPIKQDEILVHRKPISGTFHLFCTVPVLDACVRFEDITCNSLSGSDLNRVHHWIITWNLNYESLKLSKKYFARYTKYKNFTKGHTATKYPPLKTVRAWLEIMQFVELKDLAVLARVNKQFYEIAWNDQLWAPLCRRKFQILTEKEKVAKVTNALIPLEKNPRNKIVYILLSQYFCHHCCSFVADGDFSFPGNIGNLCEGCQKLRLYQIIQLSSVRNSYGVEGRSVLKRLDELKLSIHRIPLLTSKEAAFYVKDIEAAVRDIRMDRKREITSAIMSMSNDLKEELPVFNYIIPKIPITGVALKYLSQTADRLPSMSKRDWCRYSPIATAVLAFIYFKEADQIALHTSVSIIRNSLIVAIKNRAIDEFLQ